MKDLPDLSLFVREQLGFAKESRTDLDLTSERTDLNVASATESGPAAEKSKKKNKKRKRQEAEGQTAIEEAYVEEAPSGGIYVARKRKKLKKRLNPGTALSVERDELDDLAPNATKSRDGIVLDPESDNERRGSACDFIKEEEEDRRGRSA